MGDGAATSPSVPQAVRVCRRRRETADTWTLEIEPPAGRARWDFEPGQFNMLYMFGVGESAISLSGSPVRPDRLVHTIRAVGAVSEGLTRLGCGEWLGVRGPFGAGWPLRQAAGRDVLVIAGGLGLAPLRPALYCLLANRGRYGRVSLLYGTRSPADVLFRAELEQWRKRPGVDVELTVDHAESDWRGRVGVVTTLIARAGFDADNCIVLICGPEVMMRFAIAGCKETGVPDESIYLSMERNMKCAVGRCGHCQFGPTFICRDGPVLRYDRIAPILGLREI